MEGGLPADTLPRLARVGPAPRTGIVHLGLGAFFRAHGAVYLAEAMARTGGDWGITGVSLQRPDMRDALAPQGGLYTALELGPLGPEGQTARVVDSVTGVLVAREDPGAVIAAMAEPGVRVVSLTVTEKGYCHNPATGALNLSHPDIAHDASHVLPVSAPGFLVRALAARRAARLSPFTVLSCDNLPDNGRVVRGVVLDLARAIDPGLADWIEDQGRFPSTMVDRIVPATTDETLATVARLTGHRDAAPVQHEPFRQWVIQDDFVGGDRPDLEPLGVQFTRDVTPWEHMKLRMLNGTHSALAYTGYLAGHKTIADCMADPVFAAYARRLWSREIIPALAAPPGADLSAYAQALADRYANPGIRHRTWQIAMDGSQKLPQRILGTLASAFDDGRHAPGLILAVAAWMAYVGGTDERGQPIDVRDPMSARLRALCDANPAPDARVRALLGVAEVFPPALVPRLTAPVTAALTRLTQAGSRAAVADLTEVPA